MKRLFSKLGLGSVMLAYCLVVSLLRAQAPAQPVADTKPATIPIKPLVLTVLDGESAKPIPGAKVSSAYFVPPGTGVDVKPQELLTDENGKATFQLPEGVMHNLSISVMHSNYAARQMVMQTDTEPIQKVPSEYSMRLSKGLSVGGFARDEKGQPVAGARVVVWGYAGNNIRPGDRRPVEFSSIGRNETNSPVTDSKGFWLFPNVPAEMESLFVDVVRPGGAVSRFGTDPQERLNFENASQVNLSALRATNVVLKLKDGKTVRGLVVDAAGKPVFNVRIRERGGRAAFGLGYVFTNQPDGRFELRNRDATAFLLTGEAEGFAINSVVVTPAAMNEVRLVLSPVKPLRLRVVGDKDEPVDGAEVRPIEWRVRGHVLDWKGKTDAQGRVVWTNAPLDELSFYVTSTRFPVRAVRVIPDGSEHLVVLQPGSDKKITVRVKAADAESGQPLPKFEVRKSQEYNDQFAAWGQPGKDGVFQNDLTQGDFRRGFVSSFRLQVRADGFSPWSSEPLYFDEGSQEIVAKLAKGVAPSGIVLQPDGQPAEQARVILNTGRNSVFINETRDPYLQPGMSSQKTGPDGKFHFDAAEPENRLLIWHLKGFAALSVGELKQSPQVRLQPWARIEGMLQIGGKPRANERISIKYPVNWMGIVDYNLIYSSATDAQGHFTFTNVPPGEYVMYRQPVMMMGPITESHRQVLEVKASEVKQVSYGFGGRTIIGHVETGAPVDWQNDAHVLVLKMPDAPAAPTYFGFGDNKVYEKARREYAQSPEVQAYERKRNQFQLVFQKDGDFRVEDVPPGDYELRLRVTKPPENRNNPRFGGREELLGSLIKDVKIPPGKEGEEFDLGSFELEIKDQKLVDAAPLSLQAVTLDGKPFDLSSLRGKPVVLTFWAEWAPKSKEHLEALRAAQAEMKGVTFLTVNLDEDTTAAKAGVSPLSGADWIHARLAGAARADVTEELSVDALPTTFLIDDKGRPVSRDISGTRLRAAIKRLATKTAKK